MLLGKHPFTKKGALYLITFASSLLFLFSSLEFLFNSSFSITIPLGYTERGIPLTLVKIGDQSFEAWIDLGCEKTRFNEEVFLPGLTPTGKSFNYKKLNLKTSQLNEALLEKISLDSFTFKGIKGLLIPSKGHYYHVFEGGKVEEISRSYPPLILGNDLFRKGILLVDYSKDLILFMSKDRFDRDKFLSSIDWVSIPFKYELGLIVIEGEREGKKEGWVLDTGSSVNFVSSQDDTSLFSLDFASDQTISLAGQVFYLSDCFKLSKAVEANIQGILGAPFLETHPIQIDFLDKRVYIQKDLNLGGLDLK